MIDITRNAIWTQDCQGKQDLDFSILSADTRYYPDMTAICSITFLDIYNVEKGEYVDGHSITIAQSEFLSGESEEEVKELVRKWYNEHIISALEQVVRLLKMEEE